MMPCRSAALVVSIMVFSQSVSGFSLANGAMFPQTLHSCTALGLNGFGSVSNARALERILSNGARATRSVRRSDDLRLQVEAEDEGLFQVQLVDPDDGKSIECMLLESLEYKDEMYASMTPRDATAVIATLKDSEMTEVTDLDLIAELFPTAQAVSEELGLQLMDTAVAITIVGDLEALEDVGVFEGEEAESSMPELAEADSADDEDEGAEPVLAFFHNGEKYYLMRLLEPLILVGRQTSATSFEIPSDAEMDSVAPVLEGMMERTMRELEEEEDDDEEMNI